MVGCQQLSTRPTALSPTRKTRRGGGYYRSTDGTWVIDLTYRGHRVRKRLGKGLPVDTVKQIAQRESLALRSSILLTGKPPAVAPAVTDLTVSAALTRFEQKAFQDFRPRTRRTYRALMKPLRAHLGDARLSALSPLDLERDKKLRTAPAPGRRGTGQVACNRAITLLAAVFGRCQTWGLTTRTDNPSPR